MKKTLSLILAALLLSSAFVSCTDGEGKETSAATNAPETKGIETDAAETDPAETDAPEVVYPYDTSLVTENGVAKAHIVVAEGAEQFLVYASEELQYHIKKVSGADVSVVNAVEEGSLPIIIATPDAMPELETLFPDDLAWLRDLGNPAENVRWGDDGFAIRQLDGKVYIFGATSRGALNGVYDFIEENLGVIWTRSNEEMGLIYDEMPTITLAKADYREKSPFQIRSWTRWGESKESEVLYSRNKINIWVTSPWSSYENYTYDDIGFDIFVSGHNVKWWVYTSPSYDPSVHEYWSTNREGVHATSSSESTQVNFWSELTTQCIADSIIAYLDKNLQYADIPYVSVCMEDVQEPSVYPEMKEPFEYAPGKFVTPADEGYLATVYFTMMNKIARIVGEKYPDVKLASYAYASLEAPPPEDFVLEDNMYVTYCSYDEDLCTLDRADPNISEAYLNYKHLEGWMKITNNIQVYTYYGTCTALPVYGRPIYDRIQLDMQYFAENGLNGAIPEGAGDSVGLAYHGWADDTPVRCPWLTLENQFTMNAMTYWLYSKLAWNPYEDVEALIDYYCEKVFRDAAPYMREYYDLIEAGWAAGRETLKEEYANHMKYNRLIIDYWDLFIDIEIDGESLYEKICATLENAWNAADDKAKEHIRYMRELFANAEEVFFG